MMIQLSVKRLILFLQILDPTLPVKLRQTIKGINSAFTISESFFFRPITPFEVHQKLMMLNEKKIPGLENISVKYI